MPQSRHCRLVVNAIVGEQINRLGRFSVELTSPARTTQTDNGRTRSRRIEVNRRGLSNRSTRGTGPARLVVAEVQRR